MCVPGGGAQQRLVGPGCKTTETELGEGIAEEEVTKVCAWHRVIRACQLLGIREFQKHQS